MIKECQQILHKQEDLKSYEGVDQIRKKYNGKYLEDRINKLEKKLKRLWMKTILRKLLQQFFYPGSIIICILAIVAFLCLQYLSPYFIEIMGGTILLGFVVLMIYWGYYTFLESSSENKRSLFRKTFFAAHGGIFFFIWFGPFLLFDFIDLFVDLSVTFNQTTDLITVFIFSAALTLLYIEWKTYKTLLPPENDTQSLHLLKS